MYISKVKCSVRVVGKPGLPGDDITQYNIKIGSSLKGDGPLRGLSFEEEKIYLGEIINASPMDSGWRAATSSYWNNISAKVPADGVSTSEYQGKELNFTAAFKTAKEKEDFEYLSDFEQKAKFIKERDESEAYKNTPIVIEGVSNYILFRYCIVYGRVANDVKDIRKSPKIDFYLYSKDIETKNAYSSLQKRAKAMDLFVNLLSPDKEKMVDSLLLMFKKDLTTYKDLQTKHLILETLAKDNSIEFLKFAKDQNLGEKGFIYKAVNAGVIHNPSNTDSYYYGENNEILLGNSLSDAVLFLKSDIEKNKQILAAITARLKAKI